MTAPATGTRAPKWTPLYTSPGDLVPVLDGNGEGTIAEPFAWRYTVDGVKYTDHITAYEAVARLWAIAAEKGNRQSLREQAADLADDFTQRLAPLPGGHRDDRLLCQVPVFYTGGVRIVPHWPKSLTNHGWTCLNCDTQFSDNGYGATLAALFVHAHACGHPRYGLPLGRQVRESVWDQIGADTGWSTALDGAQFSAAEAQAALEKAETGHRRELEEAQSQHRATLEAAQAEASKTQRQDGQRIEALETDLAAANRRSRRWKSASGVLTLAAVVLAVLAVIV